MNIAIPKLSMVVLIGPSSAGKSTFAAKHFEETEIISSDKCRAMIGDDENDMSVTTDAFELLRFIAKKRLAAGRLAVIDATNVHAEARKPLLELAKEQYVLPVAVVLNLKESVLRERNRTRSDRNLPVHVLRGHRSALRQSLTKLKREGFRYVYVLNDESDIDEATVTRTPLWNDKTGLLGPFDIIGDVHGCADELEVLLETLGYESYECEGKIGKTSFRHPEGRTAVFLGDLVDRGPRILDTLSIAMNMVDDGHALCLPGNHENRLKKHLVGKRQAPTHGLDRTIGEIEAVPEDRRDAVAMRIGDFIDSLVSHYVLDRGKLVVAHAGLKEEMHGRASGRVREFCLYGDTTGETDEFGLPVRCDWAAEYRGRATVVYGHTPVPSPVFVNRTVNVDTGCVFGGSLTAVRYPENEIVSVPAALTYCEPAKPLVQAALQNGTTDEGILFSEDISGRRIIYTQLHSAVAVREENAAAALESMSRFAIDPRQLIYLPPTMSPCETSRDPYFLERPEEAFSYFKSKRVDAVLCEEKHMGSRAVVVVCKTDRVAKERFFLPEAKRGVLYTRTGRRFTEDDEIEDQLLDRIAKAMERSGLWDALRADWVCLDAELLPWSYKAEDLLRTQYAAAGAAARAFFPKAEDALSRCVSRIDLLQDWSAAKEDSSRPADPSRLQARFLARKELTERYEAAYRGYCRPVSGILDIRIAPFHLMATSDALYVDKTHDWHMGTLAKLCEADPELLLATRTLPVTLADEDSVQKAIDWWTSLTEKGGEGMVVKPWDFCPKRGVQPAVKVRGREYLRIIYGPEYTAEDQLPRLKARNLHIKRSLALREFALGIEALARFVKGEGLSRVHECVFGVLALESEPVDPRL